MTKYSGNIISLISMRMACVRFLKPFYWWHHQLYTWCVYVQATFFFQLLAKSKNGNFFRCHSRDSHVIHFEFEFFFDDHLHATFFFVATLQYCIFSLTKPIWLHVWYTRAKFKRKQHDSGNSTWNIQSTYLKYGTIFTLYRAEFAHNHAWNCIKLTHTHKNVSAYTF